MPRLVNNTALQLWSLPWRSAPEADALTVVVKATCDVVAGEAARLRDECDLPSGDQHPDDELRGRLDYPSDFAVHKLKADVVLLGHAYPPQRGATARSLEFRFGHRGNHFDRRLALFGPRRWHMGAMSAPARLEPTPVSFERAFGGPGFAPNPIGVGYGGAKGPDGVAWLPQLEDPNRLIKGPGDSPAPACFAPIPMMWPARWSKLGSYDGTWLKTRWPYFPADFDWGFFQAAPPAQQLEHLRGDEPFEIVGMHPDHPQLSGQLPGVRPRAFAKKTAEAGGGFAEVSLVLDTVVFDLDAEKVNLVWRGLHPVSADHAPEIDALYLLLDEPGSTPASLEQAHERFAADEAAAAASPPGPEGEALAGVDEGGASDGADEGAEAPAVSAEALGAGGVPGHWFDDRAAARRPLPPVSDIDAQLQSELVRASAVSVAWLEDLRQRSARAPALRAAVAQALADDSPLDGMDLQDADLSGLDLSGRSLTDANLRDANLRATILERVDLTGATLVGADLTDARAADAKLDGADMSLAVAEGADLSRASLNDTTLAAADARRACLEGAHGAGLMASEADLRDARCAGAALDDADLSESRLDGARFDGARLPELRLFDASGEGVCFDGAELDGARVHAATLSRCSFKGATAPRSVWDDARLDGCTFFGAALPEATFNDSSLIEAVLTSADLKGAQLRRANLTKASLLGADLMKAVLEAAKLVKADLRGANLTGAETWKADLSGARLDGALIHRTKLGGTP